MLHLAAAGFEADVFTPTGAPVAIEMWAMLSEDEAVKGIYEQYRTQFENPKSLKHFVAGDMQSDVEYVAVFLPGGHGAMLGLPTNDDLKKVIHWSVENDKYMLAICHGPAALLAAAHRKALKASRTKVIRSNRFLISSTRRHRVLDMFPERCLGCTVKN